jgi:hypothetical protein
MSMHRASHRHSVVLLLPLLLLLLLLPLLLLLFQELELVEKGMVRVKGILEQ